MKDKYINDIEPMIINWLKSDSENATVLACEIAEYVQEQVKLCNIPFVSKSAKSPKSKINVDDPNEPWNWKKDGSEL
jgi:hypothetical protein